MAAPYMGGFRMTKLRWLGRHTLAVQFSSSYGSTYQYQLYAGRCLIGVTRSVNQRTIIGHLRPSDYPQPLTMLAVGVKNVETDYGANLPVRPYNRVELKFTTSSWPADAKFIDITAGTVPSGAVDSTNLLKRLFFDKDRQYTVNSDPMGPGGNWNFEAAGRDDKQPSGNVGTALAMTHNDLLVHPKDVQLDANGDRLVVAISGQQATVTFTLPA